MAKKRPAKTKKPASRAIASSKAAPSGGRSMLDTVLGMVNSMSIEEAQKILSEKMCHSEFEVMRAKARMALGG